MHRYYYDTKRTNSLYKKYKTIYDIPMTNAFIGLIFIILAMAIFVMNAQKSIHNDIALENTTTTNSIHITYKNNKLIDTRDQSLLNYDLSEEVKENISSSFKTEKKEKDKTSNTIKKNKTKKYHKYKATKDDTFWSIAEKYYGNGKYYIHILLANHLDLEDPKLVVGKKYKIPKKINKKVSYDSYMKEYLSNGDKEYLGDFKITGYDIYCPHCCGGKSDGVTSSGHQATVGKTVALNRVYDIPYGTIIYIEDYGYFTLEDTGLAEGYVDIACDCHEDCYSLTSDNLKKVYVVNV